MRTYASKAHVSGVLAARGGEIKLAAPGGVGSVGDIAALVGSQLELRRLALINERTPREMHAPDCGPH